MQCYPMTSLMVLYIAHRPAASRDICPCSSHQLEWLLLQKSEKVCLMYSLPADIGLHAAEGGVQGNTADTICC